MDGNGGHCKSQCSLEIAVAKGMYQSQTYSYRIFLFNISLPFMGSSSPMVHSREFQIIIIICIEIYFLSILFRNIKPFKIHKLAPTTSR